MAATLCFIQGGKLEKSFPGYCPEKPTFDQLTARFTLKSRLVIFFTRSRPIKPTQVLLAIIALFASLSSKLYRNLSILSLDISGR
ncbi:MAG TPA: hypothetical protein VJQ56_06930 [Blastocatellia bacterium]|nr:hypothetical protein [Blastocatellia bacterium]